jgi:ribonuclease E
LTAEAEAEKPTRVKRPSSRKKTDDSEVVEGEVIEDDDYELDAESAGEIDVDEAVADAPETPADGDAPVTPKKRTRRGSRGGRNRKKKTATATGTGGAIAAASTNGGEVQEAPGVTEPSVETDEPAQADESAQADEPGGPVIHVPGRDLGAEDGDTPAPVKKKTRRGSRGGKNRKKKTAAAAGVGVALAATDAVADPLDDADLEDTDLEDTDLEDADLEETLLEPDADAASVAVEVEQEAAPAAVEEPAAEEPAPEQEPEEPSQNGDGDWGYTPMSQWGIDE